MPSGTSSPTPPDRRAADAAFRALYAKATGRPVTGAAARSPEYRHFRDLHHALFAWDAQLQRAKSGKKTGGGVKSSGAKTNRKTHKEN